MSRSERTLGLVPKLWTETIEGHRHAVREATMKTTARLVAEQGLRSVTMSQVAEETGIGRATLYKYFPDVDAILAAWHERQVDRHLAQLAELSDQATLPYERLEAVLEAYAFIKHEHLPRHEHEAGDSPASAHRGQHLADAERKLHRFVRDILAECARVGDVRDDVTPNELATYSLCALAAAARLPSRVAVRRLVAVTMAGLHPPR